MNSEKSLHLAALVIDLASAYVVIHRVVSRINAMRSKPEPTTLRLVS